MIIVGLVMMWICSVFTDLSVLGVKRQGLWWPALMYGLFEVGSGFVQVLLFYSCQPVDSRLFSKTVFSSVQYDMAFRISEVLYRLNLIKLPNNDPKSY